jgi:hypothetical protein
MTVIVSGDEVPAGYREDREEKSRLNDAERTWLHGFRLAR